MKQTITRIKPQLQQETRLGQVSDVIFCDKNKMNTMVQTDVLPVTIPSSAPLYETDIILDEVLGRERMYRTSIETKSVIASNRIHKNEIESGKRKSFLKQDDVDDLVNIFDAICISPDKGMKNRTPLSQQHKKKNTMEQKIFLAPLTSIKAEVDKNQTSHGNIFGSDSKQDWNLSNHEDTCIESRQYGLLETKMFSSTLNREFNVKRSTRISAKKTNTSQY